VSPTHDPRIAGLLTEFHRHASRCLGRPRVTKIVFEATHKQRQHSSVVEDLAVLSQREVVSEQLVHLAKPLLTGRHQLAGIRMGEVAAQLLNGDVERVDR
jgi:hypothetical protein